MDKEYIEKEKVLKLIESGMAWNWGYNTLYDEVENLPAADVVEVRHGRWIEIEGSFWECSACNCRMYFEDGTPSENGCHYCPNCGTKMDGDHIGDVNKT